ncbi:FAD-dependent monooxygenase [Streptomyces sp. NPDC046909]|uniref:FAD-dependent monooxygenase n=1 Tax=Streptomyces sp. NPDC046909 TaxID=3155617 RepID=UPI0033E3F7AB
MTLRGDDAEVDVLIVGGGPVGLTARVLLERWGVRSLLVEKHRELSPFPRSRLVNTRSMEIYRQLGLAAPIADKAFAPEFGRIRFRDTLRGGDFATAAMVGLNAPIAESPVLGVVTSQDRLEPTLLAAATAPTRFGVELVDLSEEADHVVASLVDHGRGTETTVRARHVLAADGANSTVRQHLGIDTAGPGPIARSTTVVFDADLTDWSAGQPAGVYFTAHGGFLPLYPEGGWAWIAPTPENAEHADWADLVTHALGPGTDVRAKVLRVEHWTVNAFVAERFRHGRILLAGDAAHTIPPAGGLGMNVGLADAHNLCWKLAGVLQGWAGPDLLATYEPERRPVAERTLQQAVANAQLMYQAQDRRKEQLEAGDASPDGVELPWSERYFAQLGLVLGVAYDSAAVQTETHTAPDAGTGTGTDYVPTPRPGHRMPHLWLTPGRSTLDAVGEWFTLLTPDPTPWERQASAPWPVRVEPLPAAHADLCELTPQGALLVRPDGHIAARWTDGPPDDAALSHALTSVTGRQS